MEIFEFLVLNVTVIESLMLVSKGRYKKIVDMHETQRKMLSDGIYHITSEEGKEKIRESGQIRASGYISSMGKKRAFFFAGLPKYDEVVTNIRQKDFLKMELNAVKIKPKLEDLAKFKARPYYDNAIAFDGNCKLNNKQVEYVKLVYDLDENKDLILVEKTDAYNPTPELLQRLKEETEKKAYLKRISREVIKISSKGLQMLKTDAYILQNNIVKNIEGKTR